MDTKSIWDQFCYRNLHEIPVFLEMIGKLQEFKNKNPKITNYAKGSCCMNKYLRIAPVSLCRTAGINYKLANMGKLTFVLISIFLILSGSENIAGQPEWQKTYDDPAVVRKMFAEPPLFYAPHAFWFWDDTLDAALVGSMAEEMTRQRLNPGYAHGRHSGSPEDTTLPSLPSDQWMSDLWLDCFAQGLNKAEAAGMTLGYCDEYWWPSGQAAGRVLKEHPELRAQYLKWDRTILKGKTQDRLLASKFTVAGRLENGRLDAATLKVIGEGKAFEWTAPDGEWVVYSYQVDYHSGFDNGEVNYLDPRLTKVFIPMVHEKYAARFGDKLGNGIPGCFVDNEGDFGWQMAWSEYLPQRYTEMKNADMRVTLPLLTEKDKDGLFAKARFDWYEVVADVYNNHFFKPVIEWLKAHDMYYISNLWEETLMFQAQAMGDFMHIQRLATMPGTDCLQMKSQLVHDFKESQSVCEFEDKPFMSEIMGVAGWEQTPAQMKMTVNSITAFGITHIVPHGIFLNRELGTIPYPADWFTENPYWKHLHLWTDFSRRASFVNRQGKLVADVLLVNPIESVWALTESYFSSEYTTQWDSAILNIENTYSGIMKALTGNNIDYLMADRHYMKTGRVKTGDKTLYDINGFEFSAIVLPPMFIIDQEEAQKILEFAQKGGLVYLSGKLPQGSPEKGANDPEVKKMMEELKNLPSVTDFGNGPASFAGLVKNLNEKIAPQLVIEGTKDNLFTAHRKIGDHDFYWIANNNDDAAACNIGFRDGGGLAEIWNCENGRITPVGYIEKNGRKTISLWFNPYEAYWVVFNPREEATNVKNDNAGEGKLYALDGEWTVSLADAGIVRFTSAKAFKEDNNSQAINQSFLEVGYDDTDWPFENFVRT
ncbi:MAG: hypothetical protein EHM72_09835, partial [Calditrichaeota bacterium]